MRSVFDQLNWTADTNTTGLIQLVSAQLDAQEKVRQQVRKQLAKDYPADALSWLPTVTWHSPTLIPLSSFDTSGITKWPTWSDKPKIAAFTKRINAGWHKPLVALRIPGSRYLLLLDGHTRFSVYWKLRRPVLAFVGTAHSVTGPWEGFHGRQRGMTTQQKAADFSIADSSSATTVVTDSDYVVLLSNRRSARAANPPGHPDRIGAERDVRRARRERTLAISDTKSTQLELSLEHTELLAKRRRAQAQYPPGHPERISAERAVRRSRKEKNRSDRNLAVYGRISVGKLYMDRTS